MEESKRVKLTEEETMEFKLPLKNKKEEIVAYTLVDEDDYEKYKSLKLHLSSYGYASQRNNGSFHRMIMNAQPGQIVDHIDNNKLNNKKDNLRFVTITENARNRSKVDGASSKYYGVSWDAESNKWTSQVQLPQKILKYSFKIEEHAAYWRDVLVKKHNVTGSKLNDIERPPNFIDPVRAPLSTAITSQENGKFRVRMIIDGVRRVIGLYETLDEANTAYNNKKEDIKNAYEQKRLNTQIKRNSEGVAVIDLLNKKKEKVAECLVDDDHYYDLTKHKWCIHKQSGYVSAHINNRSVRIHRLLMNADSFDIVDHINNNKLDNRIENLRFTTFGKNAHNRKKSSDFTSQFYGVYKRDEKFVSSITKDRKHYHIGYFVNEVDAARAYNNKAIELYGEYAKLNVL